MFGNIVKYECFESLKKPLVYLFLFGFSGISFVAFLANSGVLDGADFNGKIINSPYEIHYLVKYFNKFFMFLLPALIGSTIHKEFRYNVHSVLFSFPLKKGSFLLGKFLSAFSIAFLIVLGVFLAMMFAELLPIYPEAGKINFSLKTYINAFFIYSFPNLVFYGILVFFTVLLSRSVYAGFILVVALFFVQNITQNLFDGNGFLIALFDPFASNAFDYLTSEWNQHQRNTWRIPINGIVLWNRIFWFSISLIVAFFGWRKFKFHQDASISWSLPSFLNTRKRIGNRINKDAEQYKIQLNLGWKSWFQSVWQIGQFHLRYITQNSMFLMIVVLGILAVVFAVGRVTNAGEVNILPVTNIVLTIPAFFFYNISMLITFIYSGMLVFRERNNGIYFLTDSMAVSTSALLLGKVLALLKMQLLLLIIMLVSGISIQLYNGYTLLELDLYFLNLFGVHFIALAIWALMSIIVHVLVNNLYLGIFLLVFGWLGVSGLQQMGITTNLLLFNASEPLLFSSLSGFNGALKSYFLAKTHWVLITALLLSITYLFYQRGLAFSFKERMKRAKARTNKKTYLISLFLFGGILFTGFTIALEEQKIPLSEKEENQLFNQFKIDFEKYRSVREQPSIVSIDLNIALYPSKQSMKIDGEYKIQNKTTKPIDTLLIKNGFNEKSTLKLQREARLLDKDDFVDFHAYQLNEALMPNDTMRLYFSLENEPKSLFYNTSKSLVNGTFFRNEIFPRFGYFLEDSIPNPHEMLTAGKSYHGQGADLIDLKTTISTEKGQLAIAPGTMTKTWEANQRHFFTFETKKPIRNSLSFHSGDYDKRSFLENDISLSVFFDKGHTFNIESMKNGFYKAMEFNRSYFGKSSQDEYCIVEFPMTLGSFATLMGNVIPTSEMRFIANANMEEDKIDLAFCVAAHETTHHWFGELLSPANTLGATVLTESITEYITLRIYEQQFGKEKALQFLKKQHQRYWEGSVREDGEEPPLVLAHPDQQYLTYGRGTIALNTLGNYWGHENLLESLKEFFELYGSFENCFPTSKALMQHLWQNIPEDLHYLITDYFKTTTRHSINKFEVEQVEKEGSFNLLVQLNAFKRLKGNQEKLSIKEDYFEIGCYNQEGNLLSLERIQQKDKFNFQFNEKVYKVVLDPNRLLLIKSESDTVIYL